MFNFSTRLKLTTKPCLINLIKLNLLFWLFSFSNLGGASQLINKLPTSLDKGWVICSHFKLEAAICDTTQLPLDNTPLKKQLELQSFESRLIISSSLKNQPLGLWIEKVDEVDEVYWNDQLIAKTGRFLPNFESGFRTQRYYLIPDKVIHFNQVNKIEIRTFSSQNLAGIRGRAPIIDSYINLIIQSKQQEYSFIVATSILTILVIFQIFYFFALKAKKESVYCAFFLTSFIFISLVRSHIPIEMGLDINSAFKLETFMLNFSIISSALFLYSFFELQIKPIIIGSLALIGLSALLILIWPYPIYLRRLTELTYWIIIFLAFFVVGSPLVISLINKKKYALISLVTFLSGWILLIYDASMHSSDLFPIEIPMDKELIPLGSSLIGIVLSLLLTHKYWHHLTGSTYDQLTGSLLKPAFFQRLSEEMLRCQRDNSQLLIAVIDIQQATKISANFSHNSVNQLLVCVSQSLNKILRPFDLICRFGEAQFCVVASIQSFSDAETCLKRLYNEIIKIQQPEAQGVEFYLETKIGGIMYDKDQHLAVSQLLQDANFALAKIKNQPNQNYLLLKNSLQVNRY